jgi:hypothetical protein
LRQQDFSMAVTHLFFAFIVLACRYTWDGQELPLTTSLARVPVSFRQNGFASRLAPVDVNLTVYSPVAGLSLNRLQGTGFW